MKLSHHILIFVTMIAPLQRAARAAENPAEARVARSFVYGQAVDRHNNLYFATGSDGVFIRDANGIREINNGLATRSVYSLECDQTGTLYAGSDNGVYRTFNNGTSWTPVAEGLDNTTVSSLAISHEGSVFAVTSEKALFRKTASGIRWEKVLLEGCSITAVGLDHQGNTLVSSPDGIVFRSRDGGASWQRLRNAEAAVEVACVVADRNGRILVGTGGGGVLEWSDGEWKPLGAGLGYMVVHSLRTDGTVLYAGTDDGVYVLSNSHGQWTKFSDRLTKIPVLSLAVLGDHTVYVGTSGFGVIHVQ